MSVPALAQMGKLTGERRYYDDAVKQVLQFSRRMFNREQGLFMHGWVQGMEVHPEFRWARANGWALMTLVELLDVLPEDHPDRAAVVDLLRAHVRGLAARQSGSGFWHQLLDRDDSYLETSATAIYAYAMARAIDRGWIDPVAYGPAAAAGVERGHDEGQRAGPGRGHVRRHRHGLRPGLLLPPSDEPLRGARVRAGPPRGRRDGPAGEDAPVRDQRQQHAALQVREGGHGRRSAGASSGAATSPRSGWPPPWARPRAARSSTVARARAELAAEFAERHGARRWHADWRDVLKDAEVDAVYLATPVHLHAEQAVAAAEAGKHVLCEKPMALDAAGCERMIAAARAHGVRLGVAYYRHHYPVIARLRELLASGEIGEPVLAQVQAFEPFDPGPDHPRAWLMRRSESGGGPMADFGCHRIEVLLDLLGPVAEVHGFPDNVRYREREVEDTCVAHLRFRSGAVAVLAVTHAALESRDTLEIFGTRGSAHVSVLNQGGAARRRPPPARGRSATRRTRTSTSRSSRTSWPRSARAGSRR